jgi:long-chain fatty acid transport protein
MRISTAFRLTRVVGFASALGAILIARNASATAVTEFPDNGSEQMGRGGAWVARASDPLATFYNPAGLAGQETRLTVQANLNFASTCFTRVKANNDATLDTLDDGTVIKAGDTFPKVCSDGKMFPNPQLGFTWRVSPRVGLGFAVLGPSASGKASWPDDVTASSRYLLIKGNALFLTPTLGIGAEIVDNFRIGASFQWGVADVKFTNRSPALNTGTVNADGSVTGGLSGAANDVDATIHAKTFFVPGFTLGGIYTPAPNIDIAAWYKWSAPIDAKGDVTTVYGTGRSIAYGDTSVADCGTGLASFGDPCGAGKNAHIKVPVPMEAKLGVRFHQPRTNPADQPKHLRDPLSQDLFDLELNVTWANNKAFDAIEIRLPGDANGDGTIPVNGVAGGKLPPNADVTHKFKDVFGVRLGGDYNVIADKLAIRAGGYIETNGQDQQYQNIDFAGGRRIGFALGGTYRIRLSQEKTRALEFSLGVGHTFVADQTNNDPNAQGLLGLAGAPCNPTSNAQAGELCADGKQKYRTNWPVNLGTITNSFTAINVGVSYRF